MKKIIRVLTFVLMSLFFTVGFLPFFSFGSDNKTQALFVLLLFLLFYFKRPILKIVSLPYEGLIYVFISIVLTIVAINIFSVLFDTFIISPVVTPDLLIFGYMITSYSLSKFWSGVLATLLISVIYGYLDWITDSK